MADIYNERYNNIDAKVDNIKNSTDITSKIKARAIEILLQSNTTLDLFYEEHGWLFFYGQWEIFNTEDRLRYILAQLELDELTEFFGYEIQI